MGMRPTDSDLAALIDKLQKNADKVEKNIVETEQNLNRDIMKINEGKPPLYQEDTNKRILNSLELLNGLDDDAAQATRLRHPQAEMIEKDMKQLRVRVRKLRDEHDRIYNVSRSEQVPTVNWGKMIDEKQLNLNNKGFGEDIPTIENEVEEHNIFHSEVEALAPYVNGDRVNFDGQQAKYNKLLAASTARQKNLLSLRDYMQRCTNELYWMDQQAEERITYDWSDDNLDYPARKRQYEARLRHTLTAESKTVTQLNEDGEQLIEQNHPGKNVIAAHTEAVHADWKEYLNLLICEENHLKNMDDYHKFHKDVRDTNDLLKRLDTEINQKYNPEFKDMYQIEGLITELDDQAKAMDHFDERLKGLQNRSLQVLPLKNRRETLQKLLPIEALCEYEATEGSILRGERYTLLRNNGPKWDVKDSSGRTMNAPGVCFIIPPTDPEAVSSADSLIKQHKGIKQRVAGTKNALQSRLGELRRESTTGQDKEEQQCRQLMAGLDKVIGDLDKQEKSIYTQVRPPLEQTRPVQDSADRLQDMRDIKNAVRKIEPEKSTKIREAETFLKSTPKCASAPQLYSKVDEANKKYNKVDLLLNCSDEKLQNSHTLETSLQNGKNLLSTYENKLAREEVAPSDLRSLDKTQSELADMASELRSKRAILTETEQNLRAAKSSCNNMATKVQEHCPDIERQEADVQKLNKRFENLNRQTDTRSQSLQRAKVAYSNYSNDYENLNSWLSRMPNYEPRETDDIRQVETKLKNQRSLLSDIARKESDLNSVSKNAQLYQQSVKDYENEAERFKAVLDLDDGLVPQTYKRTRLESPAMKVNREESAIEAKFTEVNAVNKQRLQNLEFAQSLLNQQPEVSVLRQEVHTVRSSAPGEEPWRIKKQLQEETQRREQLEREIQSIQTDIYSLEGQKPQDTIIKNEVIKKVPDPQLEEEYHKVQQKLLEETRTTRILENELETFRVKLRGIETEMKEGAQQYTVKEVLRIERDRVQEEELRRLREELEEVKRQKIIRENEITQIRRQVTILAEEKNREQEIIREEEVFKVQNDPQLENEYRLLLDIKQKELDGRKGLEDELRFLQEKLRRLEKEKAMAEEKITIKEVLKVEKDIALEREVENLRRQYEDEKTKRSSLYREKTDIQRKVISLEEEKSKVIIQEKVREIVRPDPKAEAEVANLRLELVEQQRRSRDSELQLRSFEDELTMLRTRGPQIEIKEIIKEVIKYKTDPETERELEKLRNEIVDKTHQTEKFEMESIQLKEEIQRWKDTKPQIQTKEIVNEILQYREDPKTKEEIENLKRKLAEEQRKRLDLESERAANEEKIRVKKMDLSQVRETIVQQEVVKVEADPVLSSECDTLTQKINSEQKQKESLKEELLRVQRQKTDLELQIEELERERRARRDAELEIQRLRVRLSELEIRDKENREKVTVKQKVVLQQDPQQEKEYSILRLQVDEERHKRMLLEKEYNVLLQQQLTLERTEVREKVVRTEKVQVERDPDTEIEIEKLKRTLDEEERRRSEMEIELRNVNTRLSEMEFTNTKSSKDLDFIRDESNRLQQENQRLQNELRRLQSEIEITTKETRQITDSTPVESSRNLEIRLESLQRELSELQRIRIEKDAEIEKLQKSMSAVRVKREQRESHLRRSIVVIDPDTGKEMRPEEAYKLGLIEWKMFVNLQSQECDWEEITVKGPNGESSVLHDRKSGKKFAIDDALKAGNITNNQLKQYHNKEISIQEFGIMLLGKAK
ncbi:Periplakin 190 kDa paraneoplastic pemphigus antigen 195 kDa cornified envelope precursor protein [Triplophysa tibetana]|uniref:Periplakin 190 kDa paraneoplastic pemphigus antigen 195 kDa cornified envelope protein n=1 Tax=Triplophysa tibetana TaxID=1572043 RepID=A0A5A9N989_9TELE|nr:Periplakin 190 kDa paraneoplastic pemphigus antigen 195 kDa cornified envelope precursor protein [Triplophysa tibetana]